MTNSEEHLRGQIGELEGNLYDARSKNIKGSFVKSKMEENYANIALQIATCSNKMDSERFDPKDRAKLSNGPGAGEEIINTFDTDTFEDEHDKIEIPNLSRFAVESESQADLRAFSDLQPPEGMQSTHSSFASLSPMCALPNSSFSDFPEDFEADTPQYGYDVTPSETPAAPNISEEFIPRGEYKGVTKPNSLDLQQRLRSKTYVDAKDPDKKERREKDKRSYSLGEPTELDQYEQYTPQFDATPDEAYLNDDDSFQPEEYPYDEVDSSPAATDMSELSIENNIDELNYFVEQNDSDDSDESYESFIERRREFHNNGTPQDEPNPAAPQYHQQPQQPQQHKTPQPHYNKSADSYEPQKVVMRQRPRLEHDQVKRKTMPSQIDNNYNQYPVTHRPPPNITHRAKSNAVPDPSLVLRPVNSAREGRYSSNFRRRRSSNNTIAGYPTEPLEAERRNYSKTITTKPSYMKSNQYQPDYKRGQSVQSAHPRYPPMPQPHHGGDISPETYEDDIYQTNQPYETTINSSTIMNPDPRYVYYSNSAPRNPRRQSNVYVSPQHTAVTPVNQNYGYMPNYEIALSPVDSGIYSLHNPNIYRPQTAAAQSYRFQDSDFEESRPDSPQIDVHKLVSELRAEISALSSKIKTFEDHKPSISQDLTSPIPQMTSPDQMAPYDIRSPSVTSSGSEGGRKKNQRPNPQPRISSHRNSPLPTYKTKPLTYSQYESPRDVEPNRRINFPPSPHTNARSRSRITELSDEGDRRVLHSQLSAPSMNRPHPTTKATSGLTQGDRSRIPAMRSPLPTSSAYPTTRSEASQHASNVGRAKSSIGTSSYTPLVPAQLKAPTRYRAAPHNIRPSPSVSPQPTLKPRTQQLIEPNRISDGHHYEEKSYQKISRIPRGDYKKRDY